MSRHDWSSDRLLANAKPKFPDPNPIERACCLSDSNEPHHDKCKEYPPMSNPQAPPTLYPGDNSPVPDVRGNPSAIMPPVSQRSYTVAERALLSYEDATRALHAWEREHAAIKARWTDALAALNRAITGEAV